MQPLAQPNQLLDAVRSGARSSVDELWPMVYSQLRQRAADFLRGERADHTLDPTALVHEAYVRLIDQRSLGCDRAEFFAVASKIMRRVLVDHARRKRARKRSGQRSSLDITLAAFEEQVDLVALDDALQQLAEIDERKARLVEMRFFSGLTFVEIARLWNVSSRTIEREWTLARAWLRRKVGHP